MILCFPYYITGGFSCPNFCLNISNLVPGGKPLVVGDERPLSRLFQGLIDEVAIFNKALSQDEINEIMGGIDTLLSVKPMGKITSAWADVKR